jgi:heat shock protein HslJ
MTLTTLQTTAHLQVLHSQRSTPARPVGRVVTGFLAAAGLALTLVGCSGTPGAAGPAGSVDDGASGSLDGSWLLTSALDSMGTIPLTDAFITLRIGEGAGESQGPCNSYTVDISGYGDGVTIDNLLATQLACENPTLTKVESRYFADLAQVTSGAIVGGELKLTGPDGLNLTFVLPRK